VGNINNSGDAKNQGKPHRQKGIDPTMNQTIDKNVFNHNLICDYQDIRKSGYGKTPMG
jgi:hypothetical protein